MARHAVIIGARVMIETLLLLIAIALCVLLVYLSQACTYLFDIRKELKSIDGVLRREERRKVGRT